MIELLNGDARRIPLADKSVHCAITSPPYWSQRKYRLKHEGIGQEKTHYQYISELSDVGAEMWRVLKNSGVVFINLGDKYLNKNLLGIPWRVAFEFQRLGFYLRSEIIWKKPNAMPDGARDRPTTEHEHIFMLSKRKSYYYNRDKIRERPADYKRKGGKAPYLADGSTTHGIGSSTLHQMSKLGRNKRTVWEIHTRPSPVSSLHFAAFPEDLVELMVLAGCPDHGIVLDPFSGTGTTGLVARRLGREYIGIDLSLEYSQLAKDRMYS